MADRLKAEKSLIRPLMTPEGVRLDLRLATAGSRAAAFAIDLLAMIGILLGLTLLAVLAAIVVGKNMPNLVLVIWLLGAFLLRNFYFIYFESGARAATPGKRLLHLRVVSRDGGRLTTGSIVARNMLRELEFFLPLTLVPVSAAQGFADQWTVILAFAWTLLFLFLPAFNRDKLRAGDLVAGTWVVMNERRDIGRELLRDDAKAHRAIRAIAPFSPEELAAYGQFELQKLEAILRENDRDTLTTVAGTIRRKIGRRDDSNDVAFLHAYYAALRLELERKLLFGKRKVDKFDTSTD